MTVFRVQAKEAGRIVAWNDLKENRLSDVSRWNHVFTTVLTDVITDVIGLAQSIDPKTTVSTIWPNSYLTATLALVIRGSEFEIVCFRVLARGWFPFNPFAAEFASNYDVILTVNTNPETEAAIRLMLKERYNCVLIVCPS